jgi:hypothetical protein
VRIFARCSVLLTNSPENMASPVTSNHALFQAGLLAVHS